MSVPNFTVACAAFLHSSRFHLLTILVLLLAANQFVTIQAQINQTAVVTTSAASFETAALAPGAIATAFGTQLATRTEIAEMLPLPTTLAGTSVRIRDSAGVERAAALFFVSAGQINFVLPDATAAGAATITVQAGDGVTSQGALTIKTVAPAIFTGNSDGQGVPAAVALRAKTNGEQTYEEVALVDAVSGRRRPKPIDLTPAGDRVFLILFLSGIRTAPDPNNDSNRNESVHLLIGGAEITPEFAGAQNTLVGVDQMNAELPRSLIGRGRISLSVTGPGLSSNPVEIEIGPPVGAAPPTVSGFNVNAALAGQSLNIQGNGFSTTAASNLVRIGGLEATVSNASATQLTVTVPFGVETGAVSVRTDTGEGSSANPLPIRTSVSGLVETTERQPLNGVRVRLLNTQVTAQSGSGGAFVLPDTPTNLPLPIVEIDGSTVPVSPPYGRLRLLTSISPSRDNQFTTPITLQQITGSSGQVGGSGLLAQPPVSIQTGDVTFSLPANTGAVFPDGSTSGSIALTQIGNGRTPVNLPGGVFSSTVVQLTPFGTLLNPGGKLVFPNSDRLAAGATATLYRLDQRLTSATVGRFIAVGTATVSADGQRIETAANAVTEATYYFVGSPRPTTTLIGRVLESDGSPARRALVRLRGQESFTDGNGGFILRNVPVGANLTTSIEASALRPSGRVDRVLLLITVREVIDGVTILPPIMLPAPTSNQPPVILIPASLTINAGQTQDVRFFANDPDTEQPVTVTVSGARFASLLPSTGLFVLRLAPTASEAGNYTLTLTATDNQNAVTIRNIALTVLGTGGTNRAPVLTVPGTQTVVAGQALNFSVAATDPDAGQVVALAAANLPAGATFNSTNGNPANGQFSWTPSATQLGDYVVSFTARDNGSPVLSDTKTVMITATAATGTVRGTVRNAANGQALAGATVAIANTALTTTSASDGAYTLNNVPPGARTLTASASGFSPTQVAITVAAGQTLTQNLSLSPVLASGQLRITLNWTKDANGAPDDLDAHLYGPNGNQCFHVYWDTKGSLTAPPYAQLEVDNIELPNRPPTETVRIAQTSPGLYRFFIHDYEGELPDGLSRSRATVQIFNNAGLLRSYTVPSGAGRYWHVFELNGQTGAITDVNQLAAAAPAFICNNAGVIISNHRMTGGPIPDACVPPLAKPIFAPSDARVYQWTRIANVKAGDVVRWDFLQPSGAVYYSLNLPLESAGELCFWSFINLAGTPAASLPGAWQVRVFYQGTQILTEAFTITPATALPPTQVRVQPLGGARQGGARP